MWDWPSCSRLHRQIMEDARTQSAIAALNTTFRPGVPQLFVDVDRVKAKTLDVPLGSVFATLQAYLGSTYVNDFNRFGRTYQVRVQSEAAFRAEPDDIERFEVRNSKGDMVPIGTLATVRRSFGPQIINRYNLYPSASITGESAPGYSSGRVLEIMETIAQLEAAEFHGIRMDRHGVPGKESRRGSHSGFRDGRAAGLPGAGRPVRKLVLSDVRDSGRAAWACWARLRPSRFAAWTTTSTPRSASC